MNFRTNDDKNRINKYYKSNYYRDNVYRSVAHIPIHKYTVNRSKCNSVYARRLSALDRSTILQDMLDDLVL